MGLISRVSSRTYRGRKMLRTTNHQLRKPGVGLHNHLRVAQKKREVQNARWPMHFLKSEILPENKHNLRMMPRQAENPFASNHLRWHPKQTNLAMYKDAERTQEKFGLPPLLAGRFPRFIDNVDVDACEPILKVKKARLNQLSKITIKMNPWQNGESDTAFEFWRRVTPLEVRASNPKCQIVTEMKNEAGGEDLVILEFLDGEKIVFETRNLTIDEVWYHFMVGCLGRTEMAEKAAAGKMF